MRIRANQGHSIGVNLGLTPTKPPSGLWHGTGAKTVDVILSDGLKKMRRDHVHLSPDIETARKVGARHGKPVVFWVDVFQHQIETSEPYYLSENGVWLVDNVPAKYLRVFD
jgi:putative RNA 2'-phosphotransferase